MNYVVVYELIWLKKRLGIKNQMNHNMCVVTGFLYKELYP